MAGVLIAAAGIGSRTGLAENKIFFCINGQPMIRKTTEIFLKHPMVQGVTVICAPKDEEHVRNILGRSVDYVFGGETRGESVFNGLKAVRGKYDTILIHDAARPYTAPEIITRVLEAVASGQGAVAGVPVTDTVKRCDAAGLVAETPPREQLWLAQTPQAFILEEIYSAYLAAGKKTYTDDAAVFEAWGGRVQMVPGSYGNKKITTAEDVKMKRELFLSGIGFDVHRLIKGRPLVLGGETIPYEMGLDGHSDADVLVHAVMDALLGAAGLGDIGRYFPDTEEKWKGVSSMDLLERVMQLLQENGLRVVNISAVIAAQRPKLCFYLEKMAQNIARIAGVSESRVNIAATTTERLGFEGREEGISARSAAMLIKEDEE